ncbi:3-keto-5-aminohexanoate cleavage protein [Vibrio mexicanus]|uniref:3-keto-5-aminohexanoate cleavage protein n=1 Tax=Vibrio mexicanus TaxID=1004326 RepID=UPI003B503B51
MPVRGSDYGSLARSGCVGAHSLEIEDNLRTYHEVRQRVGDDIVIQLTTEAVGKYSPQQQMALIKAVKPEAASFAIKELIPSDHDRPIARDFFAWVKEENITAQYIVYSVDDLKRYIDLIENQILPTQNHHLLLVLGRYSEQLLSNPTDLLPFFPTLQQVKCRWAVCAFGPRELHCLTAAALLGGDVRIGFENNHLDIFGRPAKGNAQQVKQLKNTLSMLNIGTYDANAFRAIIKEC